jgi:hypothetical protein
LFWQNCNWVAMSCIVCMMNGNFTIHVTCSLALTTYKYSEVQMFDAMQKLNYKVNYKTPFFLIMHCWVWTIKVVMVWYIRWIERFDHIPNTIEFVGKTPKIDDKWEVCKQHLVKPLAWPCKQWTSKYHQVPCHSFRNHGSLNIVMECGHISKNVKIVCAWT